MNECIGRNGSSLLQGWNKRQPWQSMQSRWQLQVLALVHASRLRRLDYYSLSKERSESASSSIQLLQGIYRDAQAVCLKDGTNSLCTENMVIF